MTEPAVATAPTKPTVPVGPDAPIFEVMASMRAMRRLRPDPVSSDVLSQLLEAATWAPTANDAERFSFVVVTDRGQMAKLAEIWQAIVQFYIATFLEPPPGADPAQYARTLDSLRYQAAHFAETPVLIVACYDLGKYPARVRARMLRAPAAFRRFGGRRTMAMIRNTGMVSARSEAASIYPAVQNLLLAARTLGLGANLTTWHLIAEGEIKRVLGIPRAVHTYALIPIGWPLGKLGPVHRQDRSPKVHRDRW